MVVPASKGFIKTIIKPFEVPQRNLKKKFKLILILIQLLKMQWAGRVKFKKRFKTRKEIMRKLLNNLFKKPF